MEVREGGATLDTWGLCVYLWSLSFSLLVSLLFLSLYLSRLHQMAKNYLYSPSSGLYSCPLAMTDGAARLIEVGPEGEWWEGEREGVERR